MEEGGASTILAISDQAGIPLAETQKDLIPLQRMVITKELERQREEAQSGQSAPTGQASAPNQIPNSASGGASHGAGQSISGETVEYINEGVQ